MTDPTLSKEERILRAVKMALTNVIKDTSTPPGMRHPLSDGTIQDLRQCLALISARERELSDAAGRPQNRRPQFIDEPDPQKEVVVKFQKPTKDKPKDN
jgi:hypothetical protein